MRRLITIAAAMVLAACTAGDTRRTVADGLIPLDGATAETCFVPGQDCQRAVVRVIGEAKTRIFLMGYGFTDPVIVEALAAAKARGVNVHLVLDRSNRAGTTSRSVAHQAATAGIGVWIDQTVRIAHNKVILVDEGTVVTGSFNWTWSANNVNAENIHIVRGSPALQQKNLDYFYERVGVSTPYATTRRR